MDRPKHLCLEVHFLEIGKYDDFRLVSTENGRGE
jgi:hypothetical protein